MGKNYKNINLNLFDQNVLGNFKVETLSDNSIRLVRFLNEDASKVIFKPNGTTYAGNQLFSLNIERENRDVECCVTIMRTSENCYIVIGSTRKKSIYQRCVNVSEVSNLLKNNFCSTLISEV